MYDDNVGAKAALEANQIDAIVVDLPTALFITAVEIEGTHGRRPVPDRGGGTPTSSGWCSRRTTRSSTASTPRSPRSTSSGELKSITDQWLVTEGVAPVIEAG